MCELMGICSNMKVNPEFSFKEIKIRGGYKGEHKHGWGIGLYPNRKSKIQKEPKPAYNSMIARKIERGKIKLMSKIFITHIRKKSSGEKSLNNTHPFSRTLFGKDGVFAHNGTVGKFESKDGIFTEKLTHFKPKGETDSEYAFCFILDRLYEKCNENSDIEEMARVIEEVSDYIKRYGRFNFILSDSNYIYAFGDDSLRFIQREYTDKTLTLEDSDYRIKASDMKNKGEKAIIIATRSLTKEEDWLRFEGLKVFKDGEEIKLLTAQQKEAIKYTKGPLLIVAGPGAGKTKVLIHKVKHLIKNEKIKPSEMVLTTFTVKASEELRKRIQDNALRAET